MIEFSAADIAEITSGSLSPSARAEASLRVSSATTDSRESRAGGLFFAKRGEVSDGHLHAAQAFANGAVLAVAEHAVLDDAGADLPAVIVADTVLAMGALAAEAVRRLREHSALTVIGITGSAGKTTTKDLLYGILAAEGTTVAPTGSFNGEVGVPLTIFSAEYGTRYLIIEMGATRRGNIDYLARMVRPDVGVVLCVGSAHAGEFGGIENIAVAKGELLEALDAAGTAIINADDERVLAMRERTAARRMYFTSSTDFRPADGPVLTAVHGTTTTAGHPTFELKLPDGSMHAVTSPLIGLHQIDNLLAAAAVAWAVGVPGERIARALNTTGAASRWRMERTERPDGVTVINDAYNANPESMRAALRTLAELGRDRRTWAVLGEMLELGERSIEEHDLLGRVAVRLNISRLLAIGSGTRALYNGAVLEGSWGEEAQHVPDVETAERLLEQELRPGDLVLFKSSNGAGLRFLGDRIALRTDAIAPPEGPQS